MSGHLHHWRDTLQDLGVMGLIPPPYQGVALPDTPSLPVETVPVKRMDLEKTNVPPASAAPSGPRAYPPAEAVAGAANRADRVEARRGHESRAGRLLERFLE